MRVSWRGGKSWANGVLDLGRHNNGSDSFTLGRPDPSKLKAKIYTLNPSHLGFVDPQRPFLVVKEQGHTEYHADLNVDKGGRLTAVCGEIEERRFAFEVILSKKEKTTAQTETAAPTFRHRGLVLRT